VNRPTTPAVARAPAAQAAEPDAQAAEPLRLAGPVTFATAPGVLAAAAPALARGARDVDLAGCGEFDSSLIAVLLELRRRAAGTGRGCAIRNAPANLRKLAELYGVDGILLDARD
jgi:phospholipid transport system transporter-binding protein